MINSINKTNIQNIKYQNISFKQNKQKKDNKTFSSEIASKQASNALKALTLATILLTGNVNAASDSSVIENTPQVQETQVERSKEQSQAEKENLKSGISILTGVLLLMAAGTYGLRYLPVD